MVVCFFQQYDVAQCCMVMELDRGDIQE